ncbi:hypothetical protein SPRG_06542 [Saprolegnia parasitica CBS 223.65]|uniref:Uncharacterized protein n=1 Tax=Saprolegnia parasitica (strain CBS 223.65) TaxID=695850 RepID=A0A067CE06_SAPPC|nr:hypothetical protein SPRG_06542 [Saprolegnia parasitica CBS 223.65]KDO28688.1 hypothetical protein SPRG_06542 [Saprolegnia parasitica CBS 223.65]|eukprot:XP_012200746.1 hypothetical protein SPRG_06542 [Saprolegnia parasitica CBS 223.65]
MNIYPQQTYEVDAGRALNHTSPIVDNWCHEIKAACAGFGTDENKLNDILGAKTAGERYLISLRYPNVRRLPQAPSLDLGTLELNHLNILYLLP